MVQAEKEIQRTVVQAVCAGMEGGRRGRQSPGNSCPSLPALGSPVLCHYLHQRACKERQPATKRPTGDLFNVPSKGLPVSKMILIDTNMWKDVERWYIGKKY